MRTVSAQDVTTDWPRVATQAEMAPVRVHGEGVPDVVILSEADYDRFRRYAGERLKEVMDRMGAGASSNGLTEEGLEKLLSDES
jgi:PHD/YefM family antitoxin component YafN of YafNO toxin-antitoxin module